MLRFMSGCEGMYLSKSDQIPSKITRINFGWYERGVTIRLPIIYEGVDLFGHLRWDFTKFGYFNTNFYFICLS